MTHNFSPYIDPENIDIVNFKLSRYDQKLYYTGLEIPKDIFFVIDDLLENRLTLEDEAVRIIITNDNNDL